jgi:hypothetical protein
MTFRKHLFIASFIGLIFYVLGNFKKVEVDVSTAAASQKPKVTAKVSKKKLKATATVNSDSDSSSPSQITKEQEDILCKFKNLRTNVPHRGELQVFAIKMTLKSPSDMNIVWIKSLECPEDYYSIVHFSDKGQTSLEISCTQTTPTEIARYSGEQGEIDEVSSAGNAVNLAISGNGYFTLRCPNGSLYLTREGKFFKNKVGNLINAESCTLLNEEGAKFESFYDMDSKGCSDDGQCIGTLDPAFDDIAGLQYINSYSFSATSAWPTKRPITFFTNALERINEQGRGLTSVNWANHPRVDLEELDCD